MIEEERPQSSFIYYDVKPNIQEDIKNCLNQFKNYSITPRLLDQVESVVAQKIYYEINCGTIRHGKLFVKATHDKLNSGLVNVDAFVQYYEHDCDECVYLGQTEIELRSGEFSLVDLWYCNRDETYIARYGNNPEDYMSIKYPIEELPWTIVARNRRI